MGSYQAFTGCLFLNQSGINIFEALFSHELLLLVGAPNQCDGGNQKKQGLQRVFISDLTP